MTDSKQTAALKTARDKLKADLAWRGPSGKEQVYVVLDREQATAALAAIESVLGKKKGEETQS